MILISLVHDYYLFCILVAISGLAHGPLWPALIQILSKQIEPKVFAFYVGLLGTAPYAGASFSALLVSYISDQAGWRWSLLPIFIASLIWSAIVGIFLKSGKSSRPVTPKSSDTQMKTFDILKSEGVIPIIISVFCLKFVRYSFYMWLPIYLRQSMNLSMIECGLISSAFHIGGSTGGPISGLIIDSSRTRFKKLAQIIFIGALCTGIVAALGHDLSTIVIATNFFVIGFCNCGPDSVINGAVTYDLSNKNGSKVTSLVNGIGTIGGILEGPIIGAMIKSFTWDTVMLLMLIMSVIPAGILLSMKDEIAEKTSHKSHENKV